MTPKEKAEELISKYLSNQNEWYLENLVDGLRISHAKKCALIAVDEIYKLTLNIGQHLEEFEDKANYYSYWEEVKQELEQL